MRMTVLIFKVRLSFNRIMAVEVKDEKMQDEVLRDGLTLDIKYLSNPVMKQFRCVDCSEVPIEMYTCNEYHWYCKNCINKILQNNLECKHGNHKISNLLESKAISKMIQQQTLNQCPNNDKIDEQKSQDIKLCQWNGLLFV